MRSEDDERTPKTQVDMTPRMAPGWIDSICTQLERRIAHGESVRCEAYFSEYPAEFADSETALDLIYAEYNARCESGESPELREYIVRFPHLRTQLEQQFQLSELLDASIPLTSDPSSGIDNTQEATSRFRISHLIAKGGIGQVMRAVDTELHREVAVKEIQPGLLGNVDVCERFLREAEITGRLEHPGVVPVYGLGRDSKGNPFYAMRLVRGQSLSDAIDDFHRSGHGRFDSIDFQKMLRRFLSVCETIAFAHSRGIIHRDIKPQNILLGPFGETLVVDWGLAKASPLSRDPLEENEAGEAHQGSLQDAIDRHENRSSASTSANWSVDLTQATGALIGTPAFMSPEQAGGDPSKIGPESDIYSLGATLYSILTGKSRFADSNIQETLACVLSGEFPKPTECNRRIPKSVEAVCLKALALRPADRYTSASELAADIERYLADEPVSAHRESIATSMVRWGRRNRNLAIASLTALVVISCVATLAAFRINGERIRADAERIEASRRSARLAFDRGYQLIEQQQYGEGVLWLAQALRHTPLQDEAMRHVILTNLSVAKRQLIHRRSSFVHDSVVTHVDFSPDGRLLLTKDLKGMVRFWNVESRALVRQHHLQRQTIWAAKILEDGSACLVSQMGNEVSVLNLRSDSEHIEQTSLSVALPNEFASVVISNDGKRFAYSARTVSPNKVTVIDIARDKAVGELSGTSNAVQIAFLVNSHDLAITGTNGNVQFWNWNVDQDAYKKLDEIAAGQRIEFSLNGKWMIVGGRFGVVSCWSMDTKKQLFEFGRNIGTVTALAVSSDSSTVAAVWDNGVARAWNLVDGRPATEVIRFDRHLGNLVFRPQSRELLILSKRDQAVLWELPDALAESTALEQSPIDAVDFSADGRLAATSSRNGVTRLRDGISGKLIGKPMVHRSAIKHLSFHPNGGSILTASLDGTARLWSAEDGSPIGQLLDHRTESNARVSVNCGAFSPDGLIVATGDSTGRIRFWDAVTGTMIRSCDKSETLAPALSLCFSPDSKSILVGYSASDNGVRMWNVESGTLRWRSYQRSAVRSVAISPDGKTAISAGNDETARFWNTKNGEAIGPELQNRGEVFVARFSPNSKLAVTAGYDATIRLWHVPSGMAYGEPMRHDALVVDVAFGNDGQQLISSSSDNTARLWDVATCLPLSYPLRHNQLAMSVRLNPVHNVAITERLWHLATPLPDRIDLVERWARLATQRTFTQGNNIQWLDSSVVDSEAHDFDRIVGQSWQDWSR